jgi:hypothetical protein
VADFDAGAKLTPEEIGDLNGIKLVPAAGNDQVEVKPIDQALEDLFALSAGQEQLGWEPSVLSIDCEMPHVRREYDQVHVELIGERNARWGRASRPLRAPSL